MYANLIKFQYINNDFTLNFWFAILNIKDYNNHIKPIYKKSPTVKSGFFFNLFYA